MDSIDELTTNNESDDGYISTNYIEGILNGSQIQPEINARYARFKICDRILKTQNE